MKKRKLIEPTPEEGERINAGIAADPDTYELSDEEIAGMQPFRRGRPKSDAPKVPVTVRLDPGIVAFFRGSGPGWQTRLNAALSEYVAKKTRRA